MLVMRTVLKKRKRRRTEPKIAGKAVAKEKSGVVM